MGSSHDLVAQRQAQAGLNLESVDGVFEEAKAALDALEADLSNGEIGHLQLAVASVARSGVAQKSPLGEAAHADVKSKALAQLQVERADAKLDAHGVKPQLLAQWIGHLIGQ